MTQCHFAVWDHRHPTVTWVSFKATLSSAAKRLITREVLLPGICRLTQETVIRQSWQLSPAPDPEPSSTQWFPQFSARLPMCRRQQGWENGQGGQARPQHSFAISAWSKSFPFHLRQSVNEQTTSLLSTYSRGHAQQSSHLC